MKGLFKVATAVVSIVGIGAICYKVLNGISEESDDESMFNRWSKSLGNKEAISEEVTSEEE